MKQSLLAISLVTFFGCYNAYGLLLGEEKSNTIPPQPHLNYKVDNTMAYYCTKKRNKIRGSGQARGYILGLKGKDYWITAGGHDGKGMA